jgi:excisionase family DNA binding protein
MKRRPTTPDLTTPEAEKGKTARGYLTVRGASEFLGIAEKTIYNLVSARKIPFLKLGGKLLFKANELTAWVEASRQLSLEDALQNFHRTSTRERSKPTDWRERMREAREFDQLQRRMARGE